MSKWEMVKLGDVCEKSIQNIDISTVEYIDYFDIASIDNEAKKIVEHKTVLAIEAPSRAKQLIEKDDILISTIRPNLNAVAINMMKTEHIQVASTGFCILRCFSKIDYKYVFYCCQSKSFIDELIRQATGASYPAVNATIIKNCMLPLPPLEEQKKIADELDKITGLIAKRKLQLEKLDLLVKAKFVEMFGDPVENPMGWKPWLLEEVSDIVSGITKGRKTKNSELIEVPYMAVSNVKDGYIDWTMVKTIAATIDEIKQYRILPNDVLMTEGGDPDKLGRGAIIVSPPENCIHQNHIYRVRVEKSLLSEVYFSHYLRQHKAKQYFLRCAKQTTGIATVNKTQLKALPVLLPPLELQNQFAQYVETVEQTKAKMEQGLQQLELLYAERMQGYFE